MVPLEKIYGELHAKLYKGGRCYILSERATDGTIVHIRINAYEEVNGTLLSIFDVYTVDGIPGFFHAASLIGLEFLHDLPDLDHEFTHLSETDCHSFWNQLVSDTIIHRVRLQLGPKEQLLEVVGDTLLRHFGIREVRRLNQSETPIAESVSQLFSESPPIHY